MVLLAGREAQELHRADVEAAPLTADFLAQVAEKRRDVIKALDAESRQLADRLIALLPPEVRQHSSALFGCEHQNLVRFLQRIGDPSGQHYLHLPIFNLELEDKGVRHLALAIKLSWRGIFDVQPSDAGVTLRLHSAKIEVG